MRPRSLREFLLKMDGPRERLPVSVDPGSSDSVRGKQQKKPAPGRSRSNPILAFVRGLFGLIFAIGLVGAGAAGLVGWNLYERYSADLPTLDGLRTYQPPVMSRVYAGDDRLMTELANQRRIFAPGRRRRVVVATNIAETSLTIPGIRFVVDTGLARISRYAPRGRTRRLPIEPISRSSADQRKGRCGRVAEGVCIRLYSEEDYLGRPLFTAPEIQRANLADVILRLKAHRMGDVETFPFIEPPAPKAVRAGYQLLEELGAIAPGPGHELTALGHDLARLPVDPTAGRMILQALQEKAVREVLVIAAGLAIQDPRERPQEKRAQADAAHRKFVHPDSDFLTLLNIWDAFHANLESLSQSRLRAFCRGHHLSYTRMREWRDVHAQIAEVVGTAAPGSLTSVFDGLKPGAERPTGFGSPAYRAVHRSVLAGLLGNVAQLDEENGGYRAAHDRRVVLFPGSALYRREPPAQPAGAPPERRKRPEASPRWIMAAEIVETTRIFARTCARLDPAWALDLGAHLIQTSYSDPFWDAAGGRVLVKRKSRLYGLELETRAVSYGPVDPARATDIFIREGLVNDTITWPFEFLAHNRRVREEQAAKLARLRSAGYLNLDEAVVRFYADRLPAVSSVGELVKLVRAQQGADPRFLFLTPEDLGGEPEKTPDQAHFPAAVPIENRTLPLHYAYRPGQPDDGVTLTVKAGEAAALSAAELDWAVPGHLAEKVEHYLRALPKEQRRLFVPLAEQARTLSRALLAARPGRPRTESLEAALAARIREERRVAVDVAAWAAKPLPERLRVRLRVVDDLGREVAAGRDWSEVQAALARAERTGALALQREDPSAWSQARARFEQGPQAGWGFGEWPERVVVSERAGIPVYGYQALTAEPTGVALRLYRTPEEAAAAQAGGRAALLELALRNDLAWLHRDLRALGGLGADLAMLGGSAGLVEDAFASLRAWLIDREIQPASAAGFEATVARARADLKGLVPKLVALVATIARQRRELLVEKHPYPGLAADLERLVPPGFLRSTPYPQLEHLPRYLRAMALRAARRRQHPARDDERARELEPLASAAASRPGPFAWLVEEYRVSLFAQELGTAVPVSKVKLERMLGVGAGAPPAPAGEAAPAPAAARGMPLERQAKLKNLKALDNIFLR